VIGVILVDTGGDKDDTLVSICPDIVGSNITVILNPCAAWLSHRNASVLGAQIAVVSGRLKRTLKLFSAAFWQPAIAHGIAPLPYLMF
jgi:hypothetical protein